MVNTTTITAGIVRYRLRATVVPQRDPLPSPHHPTCPQLVPGDRKVDTHFHSNFTLPGAALRLAAGHYADVTSPDLDSSEVLSWVMQLRGWRFGWRDGVHDEKRRHSGGPSGWVFTSSTWPSLEPFQRHRWGTSERRVEGTKIAGFSDRMQKPLSPKSEMVSLD